MRRILQYIGGLVLAVAGLWIFFRNMDLHKLWNYIAQINPGILIAVAFLSVVTLWLRAVRWKLMLPRGGKGHYSGLFSIVSIAFLVNNILPARMGEAVRALLLWRRNKFTVAQSVGSIVLERAIDSAVYLLFFVIPVLALPRLKMLLPYAYLALALIVAGIIAALVYARFPMMSKRIAEFVIRWLPQRVQPKALSIWTELVSNLDWLFSFRRTMAILILSFFVSICYPLMMILLVGSYHSFGILEGMFGQAFAAFGSAIPLAPGYVGTLHAVLHEGLILLGLDGDKAGAVTVLYHGIAYLSSTILGLCFFFGANLSFKEIEHAQADMHTDNPEQIAAGNPAE